jgi:hypothetical protein
VCGGAPVKILRCCLILILLGLSSSAALPDPIDPQGGVSGGTGSTKLTSANDPNFQFTVFGGTSPQFFDFINSTGRVAIGVNLLITLIPGTRDLTFTCDPFNIYFTNCSPQTPGTTLSQGATLLMSFFGLNADTGHNGIPNDPNPTCTEPPFGCSSTTTADFAVFFKDATGTTDLSGLPTTEGFLVKGSFNLPEPSTILLVLTGGVLVFFFKRS